MAKRKTARKTTRSKGRKKKPIVTFSRQNRMIVGCFLMVLALALTVSFTSYYPTWQVDQSELGAGRSEATANAMSRFGATVGDFFLYKGFGVASFVFPLLLFLTGFYLFFELKARRLMRAWIWGLLIVIWASVALGFFGASNPAQNWGGTIGYEINDFLKMNTGEIGVILLLVFTFITGMVRLVGFDPTTWRMPKLPNPQPFFARLRIAFDRLRAEWAYRSEDSDDVSEPEPDDPLPDPYTHQKEIPVLHTEEPAPDPEGTTAVELAPEAPATMPAKGKPNQDDVEFRVEAARDEEEAHVEKARKLVEDHGEFDPRLDLGSFRFPPLELLDVHGAQSGSITINQEELEANKNKIVATLRNYKIGIAQIKATIGPTVTLYEIVPDAGVRISKIKNLEDDIALSLAALGIRIIAPIPGKGTIGIEVPNAEPSTVSMRSVIASPKFQQAEMQLPIAFGKTISNETFVVDLTKMPHMLMAGATGQGKSVGLNAVITSILYKKHPAEVKFVLVDPKKVELTLYNKIERHYLAKLPDSSEAIITDTTKVVHTLNSLCIEMDQRYELLKGAMVRNIKEYNTKFKARRLNPEEGHRYLPYIVLVIDEFADLIMTAGKEVETPIARLAQLARAIGIHLIIATQRPSVNVITGLIKANFPARLAFRVTSKVDSRTILDTQGAEQLIGRGDMLFTQGNELTRLQCAFVDTPEVAKITDYIGAQRAYPEAHLLPEYVDENSGTGLDNDIGERDSMFREAAEVVVTAQQGSASLIQRKLKLGYNRAGRIVDQLEAAGIVGPFEGSKARQVLVPDIYSLEQLLQNETNP